MDKILAFSGKIGAGKDTLKNWLYAKAFLTIGTQINDQWYPLNTRAYVNNEGKLMIGLNSTEDAEFNVDSRDPAVVQWLHENGEILYIDNAATMAASRGRPA